MTVDSLSPYITLYHVVKQTLATMCQIAHNAKGIKLHMKSLCSSIEQNFTPYLLALLTVLCLLGMVWYTRV